jgi:hypothetical protein
MSEEDSSIVTYILIGLLSFLCIVLTIAAIVLFLRRKNSDSKGLF